jgi:hypothetical protein
LRQTTFLGWRDDKSPKEVSKNAANDNAVLKGDVSRFDSVTATSVEHTRQVFDARIVPAGRTTQTALRARSFFGSEKRDGSWSSNIPLNQHALTQVEALFEKIDTERVTRGITPDNERHEAVQ